MNLNTQQFAIKGVTFNGTTTGVQITGCTDCVFVDCTFANGATGISADGDSGSLTVIDSTGISLGALVRGKTPSNGNNNVILENIVNSGVTFATSSGTLLTGNVENTWVLGGVVSETIHILSVTDQSSITLEMRLSRLTPKELLSQPHDPQIYLRLTASTSPCHRQPTQSTRQTNSSI